MIKKMWEDLFYSYESEGISIASKEDIEETIDMLIEDKIDPQIFLSNLDALLQGGMPSFNYFLKTEEKYKPTKSISYFTSRGNRPMGTPLWFFAGYPDVLHWFHGQLKEKYTKSHNRDYDGFETEMAKLFGLDIEDNADKNQTMSSEGKLRPKYHKNLVKHYKDATDKTLEVSVDENSEDNIYLGAELLNAIGAESSFTLIAENTTKYYLELTKNYKNRFNNKASLLAAAGILDAQFYVFISQTINPTEIIDIAHESTSSQQNSLVDFIIKLEVKLLKIDTPELNTSEIKKACNEQREAIVKTVQKTKEKYTSEPRFALDTTNLMNSIKFRPYRKMLGIKNKFLFF